MTGQEQQIKISTQIMVNKWYEEGATHQQVGDELDMRILKSGQITFREYAEDTENFRLTKFRLLALKWSYGILAMYKHVPKWNKCNEQDYKDFESVWITWKEIPPGVKKSELAMCVIALNKFAEIQIEGKPFIVVERGI